MPTLSLLRELEMGKVNKAARTSAVSHHVMQKTGKKHCAPGVLLSHKLAHAAAPAMTASGTLIEQAVDYQVDFWQRTVLYLDTLRERANNLFAHEANGMPPLLDFDYEVILDARRFASPANYALLRITRCCDERAELCVDQAKPPVIIMDPRAGHGPGIGGFKRDSEVGMSLHEGHETYFVVFFPVPCPSQNLQHVLYALRRFVEEVTKRHAGTAPVLYGNCQAGWAAMLLAADCEGLAGPVVLNGSPLSYWAGASGINPMRLAGGLLGGVWIAHLLADMADGKLDGAWLVQNFENLNPANTLWEKNYQLFSHIDTERERFLEFERWWTGFYFLSREEILAIVENLFVGNKLERGQLQLCDCCVVDLKRNRSPLVIFASSEDNITPPHQALNWIPTVYPTTADLKKAGQRIVYLLNHHVGHLGIFVSAKVAKLEHRAILESLGELEGLAPGLYEMKIVNPTGDEDCHKPQYEVTFEERQVEQIRFAYPEKAFENVQALSEQNELLYKTFLSPWIQAFANPLGAKVMKWAHPMRASRYIYSEKLNPWMLAVKALVPAVEDSRKEVGKDNVFLKAEQAVSDSIVAILKYFQEERDEVSEMLFSQLYGARPVTGLEATSAR
jgi:hypothetical protein